MATINPNPMESPGNRCFVYLSECHDDGKLVYRGVPDGKLSTGWINAVGPTWFSMDPDHDFIALPGYSRVTLQYKNGTTVVNGTPIDNSQFRLVNLQNNLVQMVLNAAIDLMTGRNIMDLVYYVLTMYPGKNVWFKDSFKLNVGENVKSICEKLLEYNYINNKKVLTSKTPPSEADIKQCLDEKHFKSQLKSVYGGISFAEQIKVMEDRVFSDRVGRTQSLPVIIKHTLGKSGELMGYRYSTEDYDRALVVALCEIFAKNYPFFTNVVGWVHGEWSTPWHDKYRNGTHLFKQELVVYNATRFLEPKKENGAELMQWESSYKSPNVDMTESIAAMQIDGGAARRREKFDGADKKKKVIGKGPARRDDAYPIRF